MMMESETTDCAAAHRQSRQNVQVAYHRAPHPLRACDRLGAAERNQAPIAVLADVPVGSLDDLPHLNAGLFFAGGVFGPLSYRPHAPSADASGAVAASGTRRVIAIRRPLDTMPSSPAAGFGRSVATRHRNTA